MSRSATEADHPAETRADESAAVAPGLVVLCDFAITTLTLSDRFHHSGVIPNQGSQLFSITLALVAGRCGNGSRIGSSLPRQHAPEPNGRCA